MKPIKESGPVPLPMIDRTVHVKHLKSRVTQEGYAVNERAVADAMLRQAALRARWRKGLSDYKRCS
jgi:hypothetical protein